MSENLGLVRSIYADWERGDFSRADWADPDIELVIHGGPMPGSWRGLVAMADAWRAFLTAWEEYSGTADAYRELDGGRVLVFLHLGGRVRKSGVNLDQLTVRGATLFETRDNKVTRLVVYMDREPTLADLGLEG